MLRIVWTPAGDEAKGRYWLENLVVQPPAAVDTGPDRQRRRPLIYIYDLPPAYNAMLLQYRGDR